MNLPERTYPAYILTHEAWYAHVCDPVGPTATGREIVICAADPDGGVAWELSLVEHQLVSDPAPALQLGIFHDAWPAFTQIPELFLYLATTPQHAAPTLEQVVDLLDRLGFADDTVRAAPDHHARLLTADEAVDRILLGDHPEADSSTVSLDGSLVELLRAGAVTAALRPDGRLAFTRAT